MKMQAKYVVLTILPLIFLQGCTTLGVEGESITGRAGSLPWFNSASNATIIAHYREFCQGYGYVDGTLGMAQCLQIDISQARQWASDDWDDMVDALQNMGNRN